MRSKSALYRSILPTATAEGRYIKGDPLNGYYDFIISEGSYKFWAVFQVSKAVVDSVIYSDRPVNLCSPPPSIGY